MVDSLGAVAERQLDWKSFSMGQDLNLPLDKNIVHLWFVSLNDIFGPNLTSPCIELLTERELTRAGRIVSNSHRQLYLGGRIILRILLSAYSGVENSKLKFGYGDRGKPKLLHTDETAKLEFNYTLSSGYALYGFSRDQELGVDLEMFPRKIDIAGFARRILNDQEKITWQAIPEEHQNDAMLACWTRKEAYGKALGVGIRYAMNQVELFTELHQDQWCTHVAGLFEPGREQDQAILTGIQIGLPVPGASSLMLLQVTDSMPGTYRHSQAVVASDDKQHNDPELSGFLLHP